MYTQSNGVFRNASAVLLSHMKERMEDRRLSFFAPMNSCIEECPQVAFMLNQLINSFQPGPVYKTFFCNSHLEAVHGAIKLARHCRKAKRRDENGEVLFFDASGYYSRYFGLREGSESSLIRGISVIDDPEKFTESLNNGKVGICILSLMGVHDATFDNVLRLSRSKGIITVLDASRMSIADEKYIMSDTLSCRFDIICWGESLTEFQLPFGAFSTVSTIHKVWESPRTSLLHSSTFGGNGYVISYVKKVLSNAYPMFSTDRTAKRSLAEMETVRGKIRGIKGFVNPFIPAVYSQMGIGSNLKFGSGINLYSPRGKRRGYYKLDCTGGSGCNVFGHNDEELIDKVFMSHDFNFDYFQRLEGRFRRLTGMHRMIQGVSGASAVEIALSLSMRTTPGNGILIFKGNFGGKTLAALNVTSGTHDQFQPLYEHVVVFDAFQEEAEVKLEELLRSGTIGLVWLEVIQGKALQIIPDCLLNIVTKCKDKMGYLIGIDEILNGLYRIGELTSFDPNLIKADIVTFAKPLTGMVIPVSIVLFGRELYERIARNDSEKLLYWTSLFKNQLGCHVAWYVLEKMESSGIPANVRRRGDYLKRALVNSEKGPKYVTFVEGFGLHLHLHLNMRQFPLFLFGYERSIYTLTEILYCKGKLLCLFGRLLPPLNLSESEAKAVVTGIRKSLRMSPAYFLYVGLKQTLRMKISILMAKIHWS